MQNGDFGDFPEFNVEGDRRRAPAPCQARTDGDETELPTERVEMLATRRVGVYLRAMTSAQVADPVLLAKKPPNDPDNMAQRRRSLCSSTT